MHSENFLFTQGLADLLEKQQNKSYLCPVIGQFVKLFLFDNYYEEKKYSVALDES